MSQVSKCFSCQGRLGVSVNACPGASQQQPTMVEPNQNVKLQVCKCSGEAVQTDQMEGVAPVPPAQAMSPPRGIKFQMGNNVMPMSNPNAQQNIKEEGNELVGRCAANHCRGRGKVGEGGVNGEAQPVLPAPPTVGGRSAAACLKSGLVKRPRPGMN